MLLVLFPVPKPLAEGDAGEEIHWLTYEEAISLAREQNQPVMVYFTGKHCRICRILEKKSLSQSSVVSYLNLKLIASKVDIEELPEIREKHRVLGTPTLYFLTPGGEPIDFALGYIKEDKLLDILYYIGEGYYQNMTYEDFLEDPEKGRVKDE